MPNKDKQLYNEYMKTYMLARYNRRRANAIKQLGDKCVDCGSAETLEFDHVNPLTKSFTLAVGLAGFSEARIQDELKKCVLRCDGCHILKTSPQMRELGINIGENNKQHKLTNEQVIEIRARCVKGSKINGIRALGREFGVSRVTIEYILLRKVWKHI